MRIRRRIRFIAALLALCAMLFAQLAGAAYACPQLAPVAPAVMTMQASSGPMPDCASVDKQNPSLCLAQKHSNVQFLDHAGQPSVPPFVPSRIVSALVVPEPPLVGYFRLPEAFLRAPGSGPPISIRNCCFRI